MTTGLTEQETIRRNSLNELIRLGINPYPPETFTVNVRAADIKKNFPLDPATAVPAVFSSVVQTIVGSLAAAYWRARPTPTPPAVPLTEPVPLAKSS